VNQPVPLTPTLSPEGRGYNRDYSSQRGEDIIEIILPRGERIPERLFSPEGRGEFPTCSLKWATTRVAPTRL